MKQTKLKHSEATEDISCGDTYFYRLVFKDETQWRESWKGEWKRWSQEVPSNLNFVI